MDKTVLTLFLLFISQLTLANEVIWRLNVDEKISLPYILLNIADEKIKVMLDTGARGGLHLPIDIINKLPNKTEYAKKVSYIDLAGKINECRKFTVNRLELNSFIFNKIDVIEYKQWGKVLSKGRSIEEIDHLPVIGLDLFDGYLATFNFPEKKLVISDENNSYAGLDYTWISIPFVFSHEGIIIDASDHRKTYKMVLDSGATTSIIKRSSLSQQTLARMNNKDDYQYVSLNIHRVPTNNIQTMVLDSLSPKFHADGVLGIDFMNKHLIKIDFRNKKIWIKAVI